MMALPDESPTDDEVDVHSVDTSVPELMHLLRDEGFVISGMRLVHLSQVMTSFVSECFERRITVLR